jgi:serine/threonine-protein kinase
MVTGELPFRASNPLATAIRHIETPPPSPARAAPGLDPRWDHAIHRCLDRDPRRRFQRAGDVVAALSGPRQRRWRLLIPVAVLGAALLGVVALTQLPKLVTREARQAPAVAPSIAVLPFADMSPEHDQGYFSDGVAQEIINALTEVPGLQIVARSSSFSFKEKNVDLRTVGKALNVAHVLEGSVRKAGGRVRVTAQLVSTEDGFQVWSQTFDRDLVDILSVQTEIARAVAGALKVRVLSRAHGRRTSPEAYAAYLQGLQLLQAGSPSDLRMAIEEFTRSIAMAPDDAPAHAALAHALVWYESRTAHARADPNWRSHALEEAKRAVTLGPDLAAAYEARGEVRRLVLWDWAAAKADYERALQLAPGKASAIAGYSQLLGTLGQLTDAIRYARLAVDLDPVSADARFGLGLLYLKSDEYEAGGATLEKAVALAPRHVAANFLGAAALLEGDPARALAAFQKAPETLLRLLGTALAEHSLGRDQASRQALQQLTERYGQIAQYQIAEAHAWRGEREEALSWLERAYQARDGGLLDLKTDPFLRSLRGDPRYVAFLGRLGLPPD